MSSVATNNVGDFWVSTITLADVPYTYVNDYLYETAVFGDTPDTAGKVFHTERTNSIREANEIHERIVSEVAAGTFSPNGKNWLTFKSK